MVATEPKLVCSCDRDEGSDEGQVGHRTADRPGGTIGRWRGIWVFALVRGYSMRMPLMARETTSCWICSVPSKMS